MFSESPTQQRQGSQLEGAGFGGCALRGISLSGDRNLANLGSWSCEGMGVLTATGSILVCGLAIITTILLLLRSERKKAAVGRRYEIEHTGMC